MFTHDALVLPDEEVPYEEIFYRKSDAIRFHAEKLELPDRCYAGVDVRLQPDELRIGAETFNPSDVPHMEAECERLILPREAMGLGDVKFMGAIGAFLGWQSTVFSLMASSLIGAVIGVGLILAGKREWSSRLPYGPYIAVAATIWMFMPEQARTLWNEQMRQLIVVLQYPFRGGV